MAEFLKKVPDLANTTPTLVTCPNDLEEMENRLASGEERINALENMKELRNFGDIVLRDSIWSQSGVI